MTTSSRRSREFQHELRQWKCEVKAGTMSVPRSRLLDLMKVCLQWAYTCQYHKLTVLGPMPHLLAHIQSGRTSTGEPRSTPAVKGSSSSSILSTKNGDAERPTEGISRIWNDWWGRRRQIRVAQDVCCAVCPGLLTLLTCIKHQSERKGSTKEEEDCGRYVQLRFDRITLLIPLSQNQRRPRGDSKGADCTKTTAYYIVLAWNYWSLGAYSTLLFTCPLEFMLSAAILCRPPQPGVYFR